MKNKFEIRDDFWGFYQKLACDVIIPYQYDVLNDAAGNDIEKSHALENFRIAAKEAEGEFYGMIFQDSDVAKWLEAVAYALMLAPNKALEERADEVIRLVGAAQEDDGYLQTFYTVKRPNDKWNNLQEGHELYNSGHMIEAGVAYYEATGKTSLLEIVKKNADLICDIFGEGKLTPLPGHPEIELAMVRLYRATGERKYLDAANMFIDERGKNPNFYVEEKAKRGWVQWGMNGKHHEYAQNKHTVREEKDAVGHSVRAVYLYTGMAMAAKEMGDETLVAACERMWHSIVDKRMYITGGIGSSAHGEMFTQDYDLPNDTAYAETCASIALMFFAKEMLAIDNNSKYADVMELALYNTVIASIQRDGKKFFYTNPLEADPMYAKRIPELGHIYAQRPKWHACACCPPNAARLLTSLNRYAWHRDGETLYSDLFIGGEYNDENASVGVKTDYPYNGGVKYIIKRMDGVLAIRVPKWSIETTFEVNGKTVDADVKKGYAYIKNLVSGDEVTLTLDISPRMVYASYNVNANLGKSAIMAGSLVYCFEDIDNGANVNKIALGSEKPSFIDFESDAFGKVKAISVPGYRIKQNDGLYSNEPPVYEPISLVAIPYYAWGNRGENRMKVWLSQK